MTDTQYRFATLVSTQFPPAFRLMADDPDENDPLSEHCSINSGFAYDLVHVGAFGDLGGLTVTGKTRTVAFLVMNLGEDTFIEYRCRWGIVASPVWKQTDKLRYITPDGLAYDMLSADMLPFVAPEAIDLHPFPYWRQEPQDRGWMRDQA